MDEMIKFKIQEVVRNIKLRSNDVATNSRLDSRYTELANMMTEIGDFILASNNEGSVSIDACYIDKFLDLINCLDKVHVFTSKKTLSDQEVLAIKKEILSLADDLKMLYDFKKADENSIKVLEKVDNYSPVSRDEIEAFKEQIIKTKDDLHFISIQYILNSNRLRNNGKWVFLPFLYETIMEICFSKMALLDNVPEVMLEEEYLGYRSILRELQFSLARLHVAIVTNDDSVYSSMIEQLNNIIKQEKLKESSGKSVASM